MSPDRLVALALLATPVLPGCASASQRADRAAILDTVQTFFDAMAERDVDVSRQVLVPEGVFVSIRDTDAGPALRAFTNEGYTSELTDREEEVLESFEGRPLVLIEGDVAVVWTRYRFEIDGALSHTGVDAFTLLRTPEGWKITGGAYSVVPPAPDGPREP